MNRELPKAKRHKPSAIESKEPEPKGWKYVRDWYDLKAVARNDYDFHFPTLKAKCATLLRIRNARDVNEYRSWLAGTKEYLGERILELGLYVAVRLGFVKWCSIEKPKLPQYQVTFAARPKRPGAFLTNKPCESAPRTATTPRHLSASCVLTTLREVFTDWQRTRVLKAFEAELHTDFEDTLAIIVEPFEITYVLSRVFRALPDKTWDTSPGYNFGCRTRFVRLTPRVVSASTSTKLLKDASFVTLRMDCFVMRSWYENSIVQRKQKDFWYINGTGLQRPVLRVQLSMQSYLEEYQRLKHIRAVYPNDIAFSVLKFCTDIETQAMSALYKEFTV